MGYLKFSIFVKYKLDTFMKKYVYLLLLALVSPIYSIAQTRIDTIYYDKQWRGCDSKVFASYMRIAGEDSSARKRYKTFYSTGEVQSEGEYLCIDYKDDSRSIFDGECVTYYKSGLVETKSSWANGQLNGDHFQYDEEGLVLVKCHYLNGVRHGLYTKFYDKGRKSIQVEYLNGVPCNDEYILSNDQGLVSRLNFHTNQPIYDIPSYRDILVKDIDDVIWLIYSMNNIQLAMSSFNVRDFGKYTQLQISIVNYSMQPIEFDPGLITASITKKNLSKQPLYVYPASDYLQKVERHQNWNLFSMALLEGLAASRVGYSTTTSVSSDNGYAHSYGVSSGIVLNGTNYTTSRTYDATAAYQAQLLARDQIEKYSTYQFQQRKLREEGYLKRVIINPGEGIYGYVYVELQYGKSTEVIVDIGGVKYPFIWDAER